MQQSTTFVPQLPLSLPHGNDISRTGQKSPLSPRRNKNARNVVRKPHACAKPQGSPSPASSTDPEVDKNPASEPPTPILSLDQLKTTLQGTMLADEPLARVYSAKRDGFSNDTFFDAQLPLGGVPSLVLGQTEAGVLFGGYSSYGFYARDDYREATTSRSMFVFTVDKDEVIFADDTDSIHYDFYDYAIRFGAALLGIPMNPDKHILKSDMGTSSCRLPNGQTSVFGDATLAKINDLEVWVAEKYVVQQPEKDNKPFGGLFSGLFG